MIKTYLDIETAPNLGYVWGKWEQNVLDMKSDWYIMSYAYKHEGDSKVTVVALPDFAGYKRNPESDKALSKSLWSVVDRSDVIIAHNGDQFDLPKINTRFLTHGLNPPTPYKTIDTLKMARRNFAFDSNKLDDLGRYLGVGRKLPNTGFNLWKRCMAYEFDREAWDTMKKYNAHDVELLEKVYHLLRPWDAKHPAINLGQAGVCPKCGSDKVQRRGFNYTLLSKSQRFQCMDCHGWFAGASRRIK